MVRRVVADVSVARIFGYEMPLFDLREIGEGWVLCGWFSREDDWYRAPYSLAGSAG